MRIAKPAALAVTAAALATAAAVAGGTTPAEAAPKNARVSGAGDVRLTYWPDKDIRSFSFDAVGKPYSQPRTGAPDGLPTDARGTVRVSHWVAAENVTVRFRADVDCLVTSPGNAVLTAVVTEADGPVADWVGKRLGFSVQRDRVGFSWSVVNGDQNEQGEWQEGKAGTCMAPAAFAPVTRGGFAVRHADLQPVPAP
ncbi:hypothetical protein [Actinomadura rugatobispora]|uniref:Uncharacterized protein n=1 Tax=Actinomadura rugatobispora TaxID=1994 RepID=A0ABW0ZV70_9ACTN|nr:hypothetical protein GCM10010200_051440 [Actinomadura rugatobispora]